jgi:DNA-binding FadR family transcriptional regulator
MTATRRPRLSDVLYQDMLGQIQSGKLPAESRLPSELELSTRFKVSRPIVREALRRLRNDGLIQSRQGAGSFVSRANGPAAALPMRAMEQAAVEALPPLQSIEDVRKFYEFRLAVEGESAYWAAVNHTPESLKRMGAELKALYDAIRSDQIGVNQDFAFHMSIANASQNQYFEASLMMLKNHLNFLIDLARNFSKSASYTHMQAVQGDHLSIYEAIEKRDAEGAREAMRKHIVNAQQRVFFGRR